MALIDGVVEVLTQIGVVVAQVLATITMSLQLLRQLRWFGFDGDTRDKVNE